VDVAAVALLLAAMARLARARVVGGAHPFERGAVGFIFRSGAEVDDLGGDGVGWRGHGHSLSFESDLRSRCTAGVRNNFSIRSASSNRSSTRKRRSGANFKLTRRATSPRRNFLLRSSAAITASVSLPPSGIT